YRQMGSYEAALADFDRAIELDEKYAGAIASRGETYRQMGSYAAALADLKQAITFDEAPYHLENLADLYDDLDEWEQVLATYARIQEIASGNPYAYNNLGLKLMARELYEEALAAFQCRIEMEPETAVSANLAVTAIHIIRGQNELARDYLDRAADLLSSQAGRDLKDASAYDYDVAQYSLYSNREDVLERWHNWLSQYHHTEKEIGEEIDFLQRLAAAPQPPLAAAAVLELLNETNSN
ncbi:MAG: tetratricopeptide repeat protein, partial [Anaerolinea sp.]|nr:tetratricopeptide repeat protein [Anaerolinea sp.]